MRQNSFRMKILFRGRLWVLLIAALIAFQFASCEKKVQREGQRISASEAERLDLAAAEKAVARAEFEQAMALYDRFLADFPHSTNAALAHQKKGEILYWQKDYAAAEKEFQFVVTSYPQKPERQDAAWGLGLCYYQQERWNDAVAALNPIYELAADPDRRDQVGLLLAECELRQHDFLHAAEWYARLALDTSNTEHQARAKKLAVRIVEEKLDSDELEALVQTFPQSFPADYALLSLALIAEQQARMEKAHAYIERLLREHGQSEVKGQALALREKLKQLLIVEPRRLGLILPLSGKGHRFGERALKGALLAAKVFGTTPVEGSVELRVKDLSSDPLAAAKAVEGLVRDDHVIAIIGPILSQTAKAAATKAQELRVPLIALSFEESIPDYGPMIFRNCLTKSAQVDAILDWAMEKKGMRRFAILYPEDSYGTEFMNLFWATVEHRGGKVKAAERYDPKKTDFGPQIRKMVGLYYLEARRRELESIKDEEARQSIEGLRPEDFNPEIDFDAIFIPDSWNLIAMIAPQLRYYRVTGVQLLGTSAWHSENLVKETMLPDIENAVFPDRFAPEIKLSDFENYRYKYQAAFDQDPALMDAQAFDVVKILINLLNEQDIKNRSDMARALSRVRSYPGVMGEITVTQSGDWAGQVYLLTFQEGKIKRLR